MNLKTNFVNISCFTQHRITYDSPMAAPLFQNFAKDGFIPQIIPGMEFEIINGKPAPAPKMINELILVNKNRSLNISFEGPKYSFIYRDFRNVSFDSTSISYEIEDYLKRIKNFSASKNYSNRLSYVISVSLCDLTSRKIQEIRNKLIYVPVEYNDNSIDEWHLGNTLRFEEEFCERKELMNVVYNIRTVPTIDSTKTNVEVIFDINTYQGNTENRFTEDNIVDFLNVATNLEQKLKTQLLKKMED